jgi:hypothetical protein
MAIALAASACSSTTSSSTSAPATTSAPPATSASPSASASAPASGAGASTGAAAQIKANWTKFFAPSTSASDRVKLLQNGGKFASAISDFAKSPMAQGVSSTVTSVTMTSATQATVKYSIVAGGQTMASNQDGTAVLEGGTWKVGDKSFCGLLSDAAPIMGTAVPAACKSA